jgi:hypothetical protein
VHEAADLSPININSQASFGRCWLGAFSKQHPARSSCNLTSGFLSGISRPAGRIRLPDKLSLLARASPIAAPFLLSPNPDRGCAMRHDMSQVLVECPRRGGDRMRKGRSLPFGQLPSKQGMQRPHLKGGCKELNENLKPLRRFLERQVARPWNTVFSEIACNLRVTSTVQKHVRDHLSDFVRLETWVAAKNRYGASDRLATGRWSASRSAIGNCASSAASGTR